MPLRELDPNRWPPHVQHLFAENAKTLKRARSPSIEEDEDDYDTHFTMNCDQIRTRINAYLRSGEVKVTQFQRDLGINSNSYGRFMKLKGPWSGLDNQTMSTAHAFFKRRDAAGIKMPKAKKAKAEDLAKFDVAAIHLEGEEDEDVPILDTCDDVRNKIQAHLRLPGITQAGFLREICKTFPQPKSMQSKQLTDFLKKKGPTEGCSSSVYYAAYVFFEKLRIKNGNKKTKKREEMECVKPFGAGRDHRRNHVWVVVGSRVTQDKYGQISYS